VHFWQSLTQFFSRQQTKRFLAHRDRVNGLFHISAKFYGTEKMRFETASGEASLGSMNGYASEKCVFSFYERMLLVEKNGSMLLGKFMCRDHFTGTAVTSLLERTHTIRKNLYESR